MASAPNGRAASGSGPSMPGSPRRVAVTGVGTVNACGGDALALAAALRRGTCGIAPHEGSPWPQARVTGFRGEDHFGPRELPLLDRAAQMALVSARQAVHQAVHQAVDQAIDQAVGPTVSALITQHGPSTRMALGANLDLDPDRCGVVYAASLGHHTLEEGYEAFHREGKRRLHPLLVPRGMPSASASQLSMAFGLTGPTLATASACASSTHAIGLAFQFIRSGLLDLALTGGAEASLVPGMVCAWEGLRVLSPEACRPFSADRSGLVMGEGAATLVLEEWEHAQRRGAVVLAEVLGLGMSADAADITAPSASGAVRSLRAALRDAGLHPAQVDYVNAHGTGTRLNDPSEVAALREVFGAHLDGLPVSSSKGQFGHALNAAGALEAVVTVLALQGGFLPASVGFRQSDAQCAIDCVPLPGRSAGLRIAVSNSFAFGGLNATLVLGRAEPS